MSATMVEAIHGLASERRGDSLRVYRAALASGNTDRNTVEALADALQELNLTAADFEHDLQAIAREKDMAAAIPTDETETAADTALAERQAQRVRDVAECQQRRRDGAAMLREANNAERRIAAEGEADAERRENARQAVRQQRAALASLRASHPRAFAADAD